jgi:hypothetical protein
MDRSVWWEVDALGYVVIVKDGIRVIGKRERAADGLDESQLKALAKKLAGELAAKQCSLEQPAVPVYNVKGLRN